MLSLRRLFAPAPPPAGAGKVEQWRWVRSVQLRQLLVTVPILVVVLVLGAPPLLLAAAVLGVAVGLGYALWLTLKIRREAA